MNQKDADKIMEQIRTEKDPIQVLDLVSKAGARAGIDIMEHYNRLRAENRPGEDIEETFARLLAKPEGESVNVRAEKAEPSQR